MTPHEHSLCNDVLKAPPGDDECLDLHIAREDQFVWSFWKPDPEELAALVMGGSVALRVCGRTHPPLCIMATTPEGETSKECTPHEDQVVARAIHARYQALISITKRALATWAKETAETPDRTALTDEFLDLLLLNRSKSEVVREAPKPAAP